MGLFCNLAVIHFHPPYMCEDKVDLCEDTGVFALLLLMQVNESSGAGRKLAERGLTESSSD